MALFGVLLVLKEDKWEGLVVEREAVSQRASHFVSVWRGQDLHNDVKESYLYQQPHMKIRTKVRGNSQW